MTFIDDVMPIKANTKQETVREVTAIYWIITILIYLINAENAINIMVEK